MRNVWFFGGFLLVSTTALADGYSSSWSAALACPTHDNTTDTGAGSLTSSTFTSSQADCSRTANGYAKVTFDGLDGGTPYSGDLFSLGMYRLFVMPPPFAGVLSPIYFVEAECPQDNQEVGWIFIDHDAARLTSWFWGRSTQTPTSTTMTSYWDIDGNLLWNSSSSLARNPCAAGVSTFTGTGDSLARMYSSSIGTGFYKTGPENASFFAPIATWDGAYLGSRTYVGIAYIPGEPLTAKSVRVNAVGAGSFVINEFLDPEAGTIDNAPGFHTDTITIGATDTPFLGAAMATLQRTDDSALNIGTNQKFGCVAHDGGLGGITIACSGIHPMNSVKPYTVLFNVKDPGGTLDESFGGVGVITKNFSGFSDDYGTAIALQSDGKMVVGVSTDDNGALVRYSEDGTLDTSFDGDGVLYPSYSSDVEIYAVAMQTDGKILNAFFSPVAQVFGVGRVNADGSADTSFDGDGVVSTDIGVGLDVATAIAVQADGKIVVVGGAGNALANTDDVAVVRYNDDGSLDTTFDGDGKYTLSLSAGRDLARGVVILPDAKIVVAGFSSNSKFFAIRLNSDSSLDTSFDGDGIVETAIVPGPSGAAAVALQDDGKLVLAGSTRDGGGVKDSALVRYNTDGSLDSTFGSGGIVVIPVSPANGIDHLNAVAVQPDGKIVATAYRDDGAETDLTVIRLNSDGTLDNTFLGGGGFYYSPNGFWNEGLGIVITRDGKIVGTGYVDDGTGVGDLAVFRLIP